jgi:PAS domain S-box-containing protein
VDHHGNIVSWNFGAERLYGYRSQEISGKPLSTLVPEDRQEELESIQRLLSDGEKVENYDTVHLSKDGSRIDVSLTVSRVAADPRGNLKWSFIGRDISERKKSERMLVDSELKYRTIFDGANDAMYIFDMSGGVLDGNAAACELSH